MKRLENKPRTASNAEHKCWFEQDLLGQLYHVNLGFLRLVMSRLGPSQQAAETMLRANLDLWQHQNEASLQWLAWSPFALIDAAFAEGALWQSMLAIRPEPVWSAVAEPTLPFPAPEANALDRRSLLANNGGRHLTRVATALSWHVARHQPLAARLTFGMSGRVLRSLVQIDLGALDLIVSRQPTWIKPRWAEEPEVWCDLLRAALSKDETQREATRVGALQLIARELARAAEIDEATNHGVRA